MKRLFNRKKSSNEAMSLPTDQSQELSQEDTNQSTQQSFDSPAGQSKDKEVDDDDDDDDDHNDDNEDKDTLQSLNNRSSLFSTRRTLDTFSTTPTSHASTSRSSNSRKSKGRYSSIDSIGKPLRVMPADKYNELSLSRTSTSASQSQSQSLFGQSTIHEQPETADYDQVECALEVLTESLLELVDQVQQNLMNVSRASIRFVELLDGSIRFKVANNMSWKIQESSPVRNIVKVCLQFHDTYLRGDVYTESRSLIKRSLAELLDKLRFTPVCDGFDTVPFFRNFAINDAEQYPAQNTLSTIIDRIVQSASSSSLADQDGSFLAPILRGLSRQTAVLSVMFGFPEPQQEHYEIINALSQTFSDVHFFVSKNQITQAGTKFTPPFRVPTRDSPEISMSISSTDAIKTSGTLGGYITPRLSANVGRSLQKYKGQKFAMTCAHVLLSEDEDYPEVQIPSSVLLNAYKSALSDEADNYPPESPEHEAYTSELAKCDKFAISLGSVIWGERVVLDHSLSDVAIVKLRSGINPRNSLGDDADQFSPMFKFKNQIKRVVTKNEFNSYTKVFKVGASTKYTTGNLNGLKMVYWLRGTLQTSEFVVGSGEPMFCSSGDSGALILSDLEKERGLGCVGLLHSYDGEGKQFGLFTPMENVMTRLKEVTGVEWMFV
ncbi:CYFA0S01e02850g1_1 [Cyberlindnera fabianii]|uniref:CYFA0S01e02850g1_1 n=1 Tax=Cyberlindnera fabianii TaxID=36022 RepID=A0A061AGD0_CYBFA|nr:CYFA0S01e02850g1_1 [Cyberlindnera fabianii]